LLEDPNNVSARETRGFMAFQEHHLEEARKWYAEAVKLDSQSFLAHYYFAAISMNAGADSADESQIENSLRASIRLNPRFAPSYDRLAVLLSGRHKDLEEARIMALTAVQLEPDTLGYRINTAHVFMQMQRPEDAVRVIQNAIHLAKTPGESEMAENFLLQASRYAQALATHPAPASGTVADATVTSTIVDEEAQADPDPVLRRQPASSGPHRVLTGQVTNVTCNRGAMDLELVAGGKQLAMHANNYLKVEYSALEVDLKKNWNPCSDLKGRPAKVEYVESETQGDKVAIVAIEIHK
jgi:tetratricopeptide (TPR) repeat protein